MKLLYYPHLPWWEGVRGRGNTPSGDTLTLLLSLQGRGIP